LFIGLDLDGHRAPKYSSSQLKCAAVTESAFNFKAKIGVLNKVLKGYFLLVENSGGGRVEDGE